MTRTLVMDQGRIGYGERIVGEGVNVSFDKPEIVSIIGPNGSGKSTVLKTLGRLLEPMAGTVLLDGKNIQKMGAKEVARIISMLPQSAQANKNTIAEDHYNKVVALTKEETGPQSLIIFGSPGSFSMATNTSFSGNLLKTLGGHNIADRDSSLAGDYVPLSMEYIIKENPEVIFFISMTPKPDSIETFKRDMLESSAWQDISAVKTGRIYYLSGGLFALNPGTPINEALDIMYKDLYGKEVPND